MKKLNKSRGFTIIELSIYTGLVSIFLITMLNMFIAALDVQLESQASSGVDQDGRYIMSRLNYDLHRASGITAPATIGETGSSLSMTIGGVVYTYSMVGQNLTLTRGGYSGSLNSHETTTPTFNVTRLGYVGGIPAVRIDLSLQSKTVSQGANPQVRSYQTTITTR